MTSTLALAPEDWPEYLIAGVGQPDRRAMPVALASSLLLHGVALLFMVTLVLLPSRAPDTPAQSGQSIAVTLVRDIPPAPLPESPPATDQVATPAPVVSDPPVPLNGTTTPALAPQTPATLDETPGQPASPPALDRAATLALVSSGIASYIDNRRPEVTREFVEGCIRYRNRYGPNRDCPDTLGEGAASHSEEREIVDTLFATVTRDADYARLSRQLQREDDRLRELAEEGGPIAEQANIRRQLNQQYIAYLNGNVVPELAFRAQTAFANDYGRTITPAPYQFRCSDLPCVYTYTGFTVKRPATYVQKMPSFVERTPLFMPSKD